MKMQKAEAQQHTCLPVAFAAPRAPLRTRHRCQPQSCLSQSALPSCGPFSDQLRFTHVRCKAARCFATSASTKTAKGAVETGLKQFDEKKFEQALSSFQLALDLAPRPEEAQAALYNSACCQVKLKQWQAAADSVAEAVNSYNMRLKVALEVCTYKLPGHRQNVVKHRTDCPFLLSYLPRRGTASWSTPAGSGGRPEAATCSERF